ncbi:MAG: TolC family protein, partial [Candidatus Gastranaerophilales bacterium]|nr:TolC family protein [Candidatus Gastranaerophilales bacterium]
AEVALKQAEESFNLAKGRYKVGVGDPIELKDAELTHRNAQFAYYRALYDYNVAIAKLENVIGIGVNF